MKAAGSMMDEYGTPDILTFTTYDYPIGGKMIVGKAFMSEDYSDMIKCGDLNAKLFVKKDLLRQLAEHMLEKNLVEFTSWDDPVLGRKHVAIRAYLAPDDQIKILRLSNKIV